MIASQVEETPGRAKTAGWLGTAGSRLGALLGRMVSAAAVRRGERRLRLCEMLSLGEKRFVAVVEYGPQKFLLAGTPQNISLLRRLEPNVDLANNPNAAPSRTE